MCNVQGSKNALHACITSLCLDRASGQCLRDNTFDNSEHGVRLVERDCEAEGLQILLLVEQVGQLLVPLDTTNTDMFSRIHAHMHFKNLQNYTQCLL